MVVGFIGNACADKLVEDMGSLRISLLCSVYSFLLKVDVVVNTFRVFLLVYSSTEFIPLFPCSDLPWSNVLVPNHMRAMI